jgi:hypothetical protein
VKGSPPKRPSGEPVKEAYNPIEPPGPPGPKPKPKKPFDPKKGGEYEGLKPGKGEPGKGEPGKGEPGKGEPGKGGKPGEKTEAGKERAGSDLMTDAQRRTARKAAEDAATWKRNPPLTKKETQGLKNNAEVQAVKGQDLQAIEAGLAYGKRVPIDEVMRTTGLSREQAMDALKRYMRKAFGETNEGRLQRIAEDWAGGGSAPGPTTGGLAPPYDPYTGAKSGADTVDLPLGQ